MKAIAIVALCCVACTGTTVRVTQTASATNADTTQRESIGAAVMDKHRTITLYLSIDEKGKVGDAVRIYKRDDPDYKYIADHIGPLNPGESKAVYPWEK